MATFCGPLFIVGMPRSGTKLVRALLNQHPSISLTLAESHFIPYFIKKFGNPPPFGSRAEMAPLLRELRQTAFFSTMQRAGYEFDESSFGADVVCNSWSAIFEQIFRHFGDKKDARDAIWGDKTPGYINHLPLLKRVFPHAKFMHVIRDPRDYCLSVRKSFAKSIYRAAHRWRHGVANAHKYGSMLGSDYHEMHYEMLLEKPVSTMKDAASFLNIAYDDRLVDLVSAPEDLGDAKGHRKIVTDNKKKYRTQLAAYEIKRIEEIVCDVAKSVGYRLENNVSHRALYSVTLRMLKLHDGVASLRHHVGAEGELTKGARRFVHHYFMSSWRGVANGWVLGALLGG